MIVVDASVLAPALGDDGAAGDIARARLAGERLVAPDLIDLEVVSVWRRQRAAGDLLERRAQLALTDLAELPIERVSHRRLAPLTWALRDNVTTYDAAYLVLAELLSATLVTADARLAAVPGVRARVELLP